MVFHGRPQLVDKFIVKVPSGSQLPRRVMNCFMVVVYNYAVLSQTLQVD